MSAKPNPLMRMQWDTLAISFILWLLFTPFMLWSMTPTNLTIHGLLVRLSCFLIVLVLFFLKKKHQKGSLSGAVYMFGFLQMTPQLFINYKLKSVAHLPWRVFVYKALNTFIDDMFAFIIKMPTLHRLSVSFTLINVSPHPVSFLFLGVQRWYHFLYFLVPEIHLWCWQNKGQRIWTELWAWSGGRKEEEGGKTLRKDWENWLKSGFCSIVLCLRNVWGMYNWKADACMWY